MQENFIDKYKDHWNWNGLSNNPKLPWSLEFMEKYEDNWYWGEGELSEYPVWINDNPGIPWSEEILEKYKDKWQWGILAQNEAIKITPRLLEKFKDRWDWIPARVKEMSENTDQDICPICFDHYYL